MGTQNARSEERRLCFWFGARGGGHARRGLHASEQWAEEGVVHAAITRTSLWKGTAGLQPLLLNLKRWKEKRTQIVTAVGPRHRAENILHLYKI